MKKTNKVIWYDAVQKTLPKEYIKTITKNTSGKDLLAINITYGKIIKLKDVIMVIHEESTEDDIDVTLIPISWIISIK